jgi:ArsR family transcriptional regulator
MTATAINRAFRAFSDPVRLRALHLLHGSEMCVGDLVEVLRVPQPTVSRHLRTLREAGLVEVRREGRWCFYSLADAESSFHEKLLDCLGSCFGEVPELEEDATRAGRLRASGGCCGSAEGGEPR